MKILRTLIPLLLMAGAAQAGEMHQAPAAGVSAASLSADQIAFYNVGLTCPSAPKLGCGSRAKRVLATLTADSHISAAWVNEAGTRLAIGWKQPFSTLTDDQLNELLGSHGLALNPTPADARGELLASLRANQNWFDAHSIDELSRKESSIIARRLVKRLHTRVPVTPEQSATLVKAIMDSCWDRSGCQVDQDAAKIARLAKLDEPGLQAFREAIALGYRPLENEE